jgi:hypothetical protein
VTARTLCGLALALAGCTALAPDVGAPLVGGCKDADSNPAVPVSFARDLKPLIGRMAGGCGCHLPNGAGPGPATQLVGLELSSYAALRAGGVNTGARIVIAGQPCASLLYQKVSEAPPFGSRMPLSGPPYLTDAEEELFHDWIAEGAADN